MSEPRTLYALKISKADADAFEGWQAKIDRGVMREATVDDLDLEAATEALEQFMPTVYTAYGLTRDAAMATLRAALGGIDE